MDNNFGMRLRAYVKANPDIVKMRETSVPGVFVLKYTKRAFWEGRWNEFTEECRGVLVDADMNVVSYPFTKIYNYGIEDRSLVLPPDEVVTVQRKVNGFMGAVTLHKGELLFSTTGSTDSPFVTMFKELFDEECLNPLFSNGDILFKTRTFMFEVCHPQDPHIVPEQPGLYYLGSRFKMWGSSIDHESNYDMRGLRPGSCKMTMAEMLDEVKRVKHEGFVFYTADGRSGKIKSPYYLMTKLFGRGNVEKLLSGRAKTILDEEFYPLVDHVARHREEFEAMEEQPRIEFVRKFLDENYYD